MKKPATGGLFHLRNLYYPETLYILRSELRPIEIQARTKRLDPDRARGIPLDNISGSLSFRTTPIVLEKQSHQPDQCQHGEHYNSEENNNHRFHDSLQILSERVVRSNDSNLSPLSEEVKKKFIHSEGQVVNRNRPPPCAETLFHKESWFQP